MIFGRTTVAMMLGNATRRRYCTLGVNQIIAIVIFTVFYVLWHGYVTALPSVRSGNGHARSKCPPSLKQAGMGVLYKHLVIEPLAADEHFRPNFYRGLVLDAEDKSHLIPYLLGKHVDFRNFNRTVLIDIGANTFQSSVKWFLDNYPGQFREIYAFESKKGLFGKPYFGKDPALKPKFRLFESRVGTKNGKDEIDIVHFMRGIHLHVDDMVVMKMDIEEAEYEVLRYMEDNHVLPLIDELMVEIHYNHSYMAHFGWQDLFTHTIADAVELFRHLRQDVGMFVHPWP